MFEWIRFLKSLAKRLHWGSNSKSSLHTSLQQLLNVKQQLTTAACWHSSWLVKQSTMSGITGLLECVLIFFLRSMVTANKARVGGGGAPAGIRKGIRDCKA